MKRMHLLAWSATLATALAGGCGGANVPSDAASNDAPPPTPPHSNTPSLTSEHSDHLPAKESSKSAGASDWAAVLGQPEPSAPKDSAHQASPPLTAAPGKELKEAAVGMGAKGHYGGGGFITTPVEAYWNVQERLTLAVVQHNLDLYKAGSPDGKGPKSNAEFMQKVVKENDVKLPELPAGCRYIYDPRQEKLFVEQPKEP